MNTKKLIIESLVIKEKNKMNQKKLIIESLNRCKIRVHHINSHNYFSLTELAGYIKTEPEVKVIQGWFRLKKTIEFLTEWEQQHNPKFRQVELELKTLSIQKWIKSTLAIGVIAKRGNDVGGTWAHIDIAIQFMKWMQYKNTL